MIKNKRSKKPNFKVKHPYSNLIASMFVGVVMLFSSVTALSTNFFGLSAGFKTRAFGGTGQGTIANPLRVSTREDLLHNNTKAVLAAVGGCVVLDADVDLGNSYLLDGTLNGVFDANGKTITSSRPLVKNNAGVIKNLNYKVNETVSTYAYSSFVVEEINSGLVQNTKVVSYGKTIVVSSEHFGAIAKQNDGEIEKVINNQSVNNTFGNARFVGGIVAVNTGDVKNAVNYADIQNSGLITVIHSGANPYHSATGGIVGVNMSQSSKQATVTDSYNKGAIYGASAGTSALGFGADGGHAGGIVGLAQTGSAVQTLKSLINYGDIFAGNGGAGANGAGGSAPSQGGQGGFVGGIGGNAGAIVGTYINTKNIQFENIYNYGALVAGFGGNGGNGGGGAGATATIYAQGGTSSVLVSNAVNGNSDSVGGLGATYKFAYATPSLLISASGGGGAGAAAGTNGIVNTEVNERQSITRTSATNGGAGNTSNNGGYAGTGFNSGSKGEATYYASLNPNAANANEKYLITVSAGGHGGIGQKANTTEQNIMFGKQISLNKTTYTGFDFESQDGWVVTPGHIALVFEDNEVLVELAVKVVYDNQQQPNFADYVTVTVGGQDFAGGAIGSKQLVTITSKGNYLMKLTGVDAAFDFQPVDYGTKISTQFELSRNDISGQETEIIIYLKDQLQGQGTESQPYLIGSEKELSLVDLYDSADVFFKISQNFTIAHLINQVSELHGNLNGNNKTITIDKVSNALINKNHAEIKNLTIVAKDINASSVLLSENNGTLKNVRITANTTFKATQNFGLIATVNNGVIEKSFVTSNLSYTGFAAGVTTTVLGGMVGQNNGTITESGVNFEVTGTTTLNGSTLGLVAGKNSGEISYSYGIGTLSANGAVLSGVAYSEGPAGVVSHSYSAATLTTNSSVYGVSNRQDASYADAQGKTAEQFAGWDFNKVWALNTYLNNGLPVLRNTLTQVAQGGFADLGLAPSDLRIANNVNISNIAALTGILENIATFAENHQPKTITIVNDINAKGYSLGGYVLPQNVTLEGNGFALYNLNNSRAIFNENNGTIQNLTMNQVKLENIVGEFAAVLVNTNNGAVKNVSVDAYVTSSLGSLTAIGGIIANEVYTSDTTGLVFKGTVEISGQYVQNVSIGGIIGIANDSDLEHLIFEGHVETKVSAISNNIGAIVGSLNHSTLANSVYRGSAKSGSIFGLFAGSSQNSTITTSYAYGELIDINTRVVAKGGIITNVYVDQRLNSTTGTILTAAQMLNSNNFSGFDFAGVWYQATGQLPQIWALRDNAVKVTVYNQSLVYVYANTETSAGRDISRINGMVANVWVDKNNIINTQDFGLNNVEGHVVFKQPNESDYRLNIKLLVNGTETVLVDGDVSIYGLDLSSYNKTDVIAVYLNSEIIPYTATLSAPQGVSSLQASEFGVMKVFVNDQLIASDFGKAGYVLQNLRVGDDVKFVYTDRSAVSTLKQINTDANSKVYFKGIYLNDVLVPGVVANDSVTVEFVVSDQTASKLENSVNYVPKFEALTMVSIDANFGQFTKQDINDYNVHFKINSLTEEFTFANVVEGTAITLFAPAKIVSSSEVYRFANFTQTIANGVVINNPNSIGVANVVVTAGKKVDVMANYAENQLQVDVNLSEFGNTSGNNLLANAIIWDYKVGEQNTITTSKTNSYNLLPGTYTIALINSYGENNILGLTDTYGLYAAKASGAIQSYEISGGYADDYGYYTVDNNTFLNIEGRKYSFIEVNVTGDMINSGAINIEFVPVYIRATDGYTGGGSPAAAILINDAAKLNWLAYLYNDSTIAYFMNATFRNTLKHYKFAPTFTNYVTHADLGQIRTYVAPIGNNSDLLRISIDGEGVVVRDIQVVDYSESLVSGLFRKTATNFALTNITFDNLHVISANTTAQYVGLVAQNDGKLENVTLLNSLVSTENTNAYLGGLVGLNNAIVTKSSITNTTVSGTQYVGGLVGVNRGQLSNSFSRGTVQGLEYAGGLVGLNESEVFSSFSDSAVNSGNYAGGLVGHNSVGSVTGSYALNNITGYISAGLIGLNGNGSLVTAGDIQSGKNTVTYSYFYGTLNSANASNNFAIAYNNISGGINVSDIFAEVYYATSNGANVLTYGNIVSGGVVGSTTFGKTTYDGLKDLNTYANWFGGTNTKINWIVGLEAASYSQKSLSEIMKQTDLGLPLISTIAETRQVNISVYVNGAQQSMNVLKDTLTGENNWVIRAFAAMLLPLETKFNLSITKLNLSNNLNLVSTFTVTDRTGVARSNSFEGTRNNAIASVEFESNNVRPTNTIVISFVTTKLDIEYSDTLIGANHFASHVSELDFALGQQIEYEVMFTKSYLTLSHVYLNGETTARTLTNGSLTVELAERNVSYQISTFTKDGVEGVKVVFASTHSDTEFINAYFVQNSIMLVSGVKATFETVKSSYVSSANYSLYTSNFPTSNSFVEQGEYDIVIPSYVAGYLPLQFRYSASITMGDNAPIFESLTANGHIMFENTYTAGVGYSKVSQNIEFDIFGKIGQTDVNFLSDGIDTVIFKANIVPAEEFTSVIGQVISNGSIGLSQGFGLQMSYQSGSRTGSDTIINAGRKIYLDKAASTTVNITNATPHADVEGLFVSPNSLLFRPMWIMWQGTLPSDWITKVGNEEITLNPLTDFALSYTFDDSFGRGYNLYFVIVLVSELEFGTMFHQESFATTKVIDQTNTPTVVVDGFGNNSATITKDIMGKVEAVVGSKVYTDSYGSVTFKLNKSHIASEKQNDVEHIGWATNSTTLTKSQTHTLNSIETTPSLKAVFRTQLVEVLLQYKYIRTGTGFGNIVIDVEGFGELTYERDVRINTLKDYANYHVWRDSTGKIVVAHDTAARQLTDEIYIHQIFLIAKDQIVEFKAFDSKEVDQASSYYDVNILSMDVFGYSVENEENYDSNYERSFTPYNEAGRDENGVEYDNIGYASGIKGKFTDLTYIVFNYLPKQRISADVKSYDPDNQSEPYGNILDAGNVKAGYSATVVDPIKPVSELDNDTIANYRINNLSQVELRYDITGIESQYVANHWYVQFNTRYNAVVKLNVGINDDEVTANGITFTTEIVDEGGVTYFVIRYNVNITATDPSNSYLAPVSTITINLAVDKI